VILVVYAISTEQNIAKLFMAAMLPGIMAALFYVAAIAVLTRMRPALAPPGGGVGAAEKRRALLNVVPVLLISVVVIGGIYGGVFTPTESAAIGCIATLAVGLARRTLSGADLRGSLLATAETTAMIFVILLGAEVFNAFLALSQAPDLLAVWIAEQDFPPYGVLALLLFAYIVLGAVMDELAMILLTLPVFFPVVTALDFGLATTEETAIWFGVLVLVVVGIGLTAPPIGLNVFVVSSLARDVPIARTYRGVLPFLATDVARLALLVAFPALSLWLVRALT
jgi:tripartite ATP-independent transporter DctM subunit